MKERGKKASLLNEFVRKHRYIFIFVAIMIVYHLLIREYSGDSVSFFSKMLDSQSLAEALKSRYHGWTSRLFIEAVLIFLSKNVLLWRLLDIFVFTAAYVAMVQLTHNEAPQLTLGLVLMYPILEMASAGWVATSLNYFWPMTAGLIALISLDKLYHQEKVGPFSAILFLICEIFATNMELLSALYLCILLYFSVIMVLYKKQCTLGGMTLIVLQYVIAVSNMVFALTCPGNWSRNTSEIKNWMMDFASLTAIDKLTLGLNDTFSKLIDGNILFASFAIILFVVLLFSRRRTRRQLVISAIPVAFVLMRTLFKNEASIYYTTMMEMFDSVARVDGVNYCNPMAYIPFFVYCVVLAAILLTFLNCFETVHQGVFLSVVFLAGLATRIAMGFSPTLYASSARTFVFLDFAMIFCMIKMCVWKWPELCERKLHTTVLRIGFEVVVATTVFANLVSICARY